MPEKAPQQVPPVQTLREPESTYQVQKPAAVPTASVERTIPSYQKPEQKVPLEKMWTTPEPQKEPVKPQNKNLEYFMGTDAEAGRGALQSAGGACSD